MASPRTSLRYQSSFITFTDTNILNKVDLWSIHRSCLLERLNQFFLTDSYREWRIEGADIYQNCRGGIRVIELFPAHTLALFNYLFKLPFSSESDRDLIVLNKFCLSFKDSSPLLLSREFQTILRLFEEGTARHEYPKMYFCKTVSFFFLTLPPARREALHQIFRLIKKLLIDDQDATKQEMVIERLAMYTIEYGDSNPNLVSYLLELLITNVNMIFSVDDHYLGMVEKVKREVARQRTEDYVSFIRPKDSSVKSMRREQLISFYDFLKETEGQITIMDEKDDSPSRDKKKRGILKRVFGREFRGKQETKRCFAALMSILITETQNP